MTLTKEIVKDGNRLLELILKEDVKVADRFIKQTEWDKSYLNYILETLEHYNYIRLDSFNANNSGYLINVMSSAEYRLKEGGLINEYKEQKKEGRKEWPQRNWHWIAVATFILTSICAPLIVDLLKAKSQVPPKKEQPKLEKTDSSNHQNDSLP